MVNIIEEEGQTMAGCEGFYGDLTLFLSQRLKMKSSEFLGERVR